MPVINSPLLIAVRMICWRHSVQTSGEWLQAKVGGSVENRTSSEALVHTRHSMYVEPSGCCESFRCWPGGAAIEPPAFSGSSSFSNGSEWFLGPAVEVEFKRLDTVFVYS